MISNCGHDENGKYTGGKPGDQTGGEWKVRDWYKHKNSWNFVARYPDVLIREMIASDAEKGAKNNNIGYSMDSKDRLTFWNALRKVDYKVENIKTKCNADCSSSSAGIIKGVGIKTGNNKLANVSEMMTTYNSRAMLKNAGFEILTAAKYLNSDNYLLPGDIIVNDNHHMAINLSTGSKVEKPQNESKKTIDELAKEVINGKWGNDPERSKKLKAAGYDPVAVQDKVNELMGLKKKKTTKYRVNVNSYLNVRSGPNTTYSVVGKYYNGDIIEVQSISTGWAKISDKKYVSANYISKV